MNPIERPPNPRKTRFPSYKTPDGLYDSLEELSISPLRSTILSLRSINASSTRTILSRKYVDGKAIYMGGIGIYVIFSSAHLNSRVSTASAKRANIGPQTH